MNAAGRRRDFGPATRPRRRLTLHRCTDKASPHGVGRRLAAPARAEARTNRVTLLQPTGVLDCLPRAKDVLQAKREGIGVDETGKRTTGYRK